MHKLSRLQKRAFSFTGPYNPNRYKVHLVPRKFPKDKEIEEYIKTQMMVPALPVRNVRHVNPIRQSGPIPPYDGPFTMEDVRKIFFNTTIPLDFNYCSQMPEELMRRVPGLTRKEAEHITRLGLTPDEEVDFAYIAHNIGLDVFYITNGVYVARQVVTNSKGEKVEVYWNGGIIEEMSMVNVNHAPVIESIDQTWEMFLWGDIAIHPLVDYDLCVPNTWFEYEEDTLPEVVMSEDQMNLPDELRIKSPRHPNARRELWRTQEIWNRLDEMKDPNWQPSDLKYDVYNAQGNGKLPQEAEKKEEKEEKKPQKSGWRFLEWFIAGDAKAAEYAKKNPVPEPKPSKHVQVPVHHQRHYNELRQAEYEGVDPGPNATSTHPNDYIPYMRHHLRKEHTHHEGSHSSNDHDEHGELGNTQKPASDATHEHKDKKKPKH